MAQSAADASTTSAASVSAEAKGLLKRARQRRPIFISQGVSFIFDTAILLLYHFVGAADILAAALYLLAGLGSTSLALALSETNWSDRFKDHYLSVPNSVGNITIQLLAIFLVPEVGLYFALVIFVVLGFGALRMSGRQAGLVWTYATLGLTYLFEFTDKPIGLPMATSAERTLALLCIVSALGRFAFTGLYGSSMREMLYKRGQELKQAHTRIEELAQIDELTGALNRRYIMRVLSEELTRAQRSTEPCSIAIIDLDLFKRINDRFGHPAGDEVLRSFAIAASANIRSIDRFGRYGGEEFLLVLPRASKEQAAAAVNRLREIISDLSWTTISDGLVVTMSAGVAQIRSDEAPDEILARADAALYRAKDAGRNCVMSA
jgi:diguanylate cyclase (GGDEF)-like protein